MAGGESDHRPQQAEEPTRARLLDAGRRLFVTHGYHGTSMRQIAREAGLALGVDPPGPDVMARPPHPP